MNTQSHSTTIRSSLNICTYITCIFHKHMSWAQAYMYRVPTTYNYMYLQSSSDFAIWSTEYNHIFCKQSYTFNAFSHTYFYSITPVVIKLLPSTVPSNMTMTSPIVISISYPNSTGSIDTIIAAEALQSINLLVNTAVPF